MKDALGHGSNARGVNHAFDQARRDKRQAKALSKAYAKRTGQFAQHVAEQAAEKHAKGLAEARAATNTTPPPATGPSASKDGLNGAQGVSSPAVHYSAEEQAARRYGGTLTDISKPAKGYGPGEEHGYKPPEPKAGHVKATKSVGTGSSRSSLGKPSYPSAHHVMGGAGAHVMSTSAASKRSGKFARHA